MLHTIFAPLGVGESAERLPMKVRSIQTRFWDDEFIAETDIYTQHLYLYLITCQYINLSGMFQLPTKKIMLEAKLSEKNFNSAAANLEAAGKVIFLRGWVYVVNARKNNGYTLSPKNEKPLALEIEQVPPEVKSAFIAFEEGKTDTVSIGYPVVLDTTRNHIPETRNQKKGGVGENKTYSNLTWLDNLDDETANEFATRFDISTDQVQSKAEDLANYCRSKGKTYRDYRAFLLNAIKRDIEEGRLQTTTTVRLPKAKIISDNGEVTEVY